MRTLSSSLALGTLLFVSLSGSALLAQDQAQAPVSGTTSAATAGQDAQPRHVPNPHRQAKRLSKKLGLSADQEAKVETILADRTQQMQSARADATLAPQDKHARMHAIRRQSNEQVEALLNDTQKQQFEQMKQSHKGMNGHQDAPAAN